MPHAGRPPRPLRADATHSRAPDLDGAAVGGYPPAVWLLVPRAVAAVENDQVSSVGTAAIHGLRILIHALPDHPLEGTTQDLAFDHEPLLFIAVRPMNRQVGPESSEAMLALDAAASVHDPLQKRLQEQMRSGLLAVVAVHPRLRMLAEEALAGEDQPRHVQAAVMIQVAGRLVLQRFLRVGGDLPGDDLLADRIGDANGSLTCDQSEIPHISQVAGGKRALFRTA